MSKKQNTNYAAIERNIYKVGSSYRVRVSGQSEYCPNITQARKMRKKLKSFSRLGY